MFRYPDDLEAYVEWLVGYLAETDLPLNSHQIEILYDPEVVDWEAERLGGYIGNACFSQFYWFKAPRYAYPENFLADPRPERVCNPETTRWDSALADDDGEILEDMIDLQTWLIFDCMFWRARLQFDRERRKLSPGTHVWSDIGWRPLLKAAMNRADTAERKRQVVRAFFVEFEVFDDIHS
ncbi:MAG: hypothetical protein ACOWWM_01830 [Desulfobacterales bacterium]